MESSIRAELLKLNIYPEGGHFVAHRDTPKSADSVASLVVVLPTAHVGGDLSVQHRNFKQTYEFAADFVPEFHYPASANMGDEEVKKANGYYELGLKTLEVFGESEDKRARRDATRKRRVECGMPKRLYAYTAFFGDAVHAIQPVEAGVRMTLTYQLYRNPSPSQAISASSSSCSNSLVSERKSSATASSSAANSNSSSSSSSSSSSRSSTRKRSAAEMAEDTSAASSVAAAAVQKENYQRFSVKELKEQCRERGLPLSGTMAKPKLIELLQAFDAGAASSKSGRRSGNSDGPLRDVSLPSGPAADPAEYLNTKVASAKSRAFLHKLRLALMNPNFFPEGGRLAFPCFHLYEREEDLPQSEPLEPEIKCQDLMLRGADALIAVCAARVGLDVSVLRLMMIDDGDECTGWQMVDDLVTCKYARKHVGKVGIVDGGWLCQTIAIDSSVYPKVDDSISDLTWAIRMPQGVRDCDEVPIARVMDAMVAEEWCFGNDASEGCVYAQCAIVLTIPEASAGRNEAIERAVEMSTALPEQILESTRRGLPLAGELQASEARLRAFVEVNGEVSDAELRTFAEGVGMKSSGPISGVRKAMERELRRLRY